MFYVEIVIFFIILSCFNFSVIQARSVDVQVSTNWKRHPFASLIVEVGEYIHDQYPHLYWSYIDELCQHNELIDNFIGNSSNSATLEFESFLFELTNQLLPLNVAGRNFLETTIGIGSYSVVSQYYYTLAESYGNPCDNNAFIVVNGKIECQTSFNLFNEEISFNKLSINSYDHMKVSLESTNNTVILYGTPGTSSFCSIHKNAMTNFEFGKFNYAVRYYYPEDGIETSTILQGYGVFLDIKNMEYKTIDDSNKASESNDNEQSTTNSNEDISFPENEEVEGINFAKLFAKHTSLGKDLKVIYDDLLYKSSSESSSHENEIMKVWKMKDLGLQTVAAIAKQYQLDTSSAINKLSEIVCNFPKFGPVISSFKIPDQLRQDIHRWDSLGLSSMISMDSMFINGLRVDLSSATLNVYDMMNIIQQELKLVSQLSFMNLSSAELIKGIRKLSITLSEKSGSTSSFDTKVTRINVSKGAKNVVTFINNLEKDRMYTRWPQSVQQLLYPSWSLHYIGKNLYTLVASIDPLTYDGALIISQIRDMWQQQYPIRFGFSFACSNKKSDSKYASSSDICRLYASLKTSKKLKDAINFLFDVSRHILSESSPNSPSSSSDIELNTIIDMYVSYLDNPKEVLQTIDTYLVSLEQGFVDISNEYLEARGLGINSFTLNGIYSPNADVVNSISSLLGREQYLLSQLVASQVITDKSKSIFSDILKAGEAYDRYHLMIDDESPTYIDTSSEEFLMLSSQLQYFTNYKVVESIPSLANTTVYLIPCNKQGLESAIVLLQWLNHQTSKGEDDIGQHRVAFVWKPDHEDVLSVNTCVDNDSMVCTNSLTLTNIPSDRITAFLTTTEKLIIQTINSFKDRNEIFIQVSYLLLLLSNQ